MRALPSALADAGVEAVHPSDAARIPPHDDISEITGQAGPGSSQGPQRTILQNTAIEALKAAGNLVTNLEIWRCLLDTEHIRRMAMRPAACGRPLHIASHQETYDYFASFMRILSHFEERSASSARSKRSTLSLRCVPPGSAFSFSSCDRPAGYAAHSLQELADMLEFTPDDIVCYHIERDDFCRWIGEVIGDTKLAKDIRGIEDRTRLRLTVQERIDILWKRLR